MVFRNLFQKTQTPTEPGAGKTILTGPRVPRHSSGWAALLKHLKAEPGLRVLDIGPTSPTNINFLTGMGHSVYMADLAHEVAHGSWELPPESEGGDPRFDLAQFFEHNLNFGDRQFDVILLWATLDYLPEALMEPLVERFYASMTPKARLLAFFHTRASGPENIFCRYHLAEGEEIHMQESEGHPMLRVSTNRKIEKLFSKYANVKFFLAKDSLSEVIVTR